MKKFRSKRFRNQPRKFTRRPKQPDGGGEEGSKVQQKNSALTPKPQSRLSHKQGTEEEQSPDNKQKKKEKEKEKDKDSTLKGNKAMSKDVETAVDEYITTSSKLETLKEGFQKLEEIVVESKDHEKCCQHKDRSRNPEIPCLDGTRVVLEPKEDDKDSCDFIHANKVSFENYDRKYIITQVPMQNNMEDFWRMIYQNQSTTIVVLCLFYEEGKEAGEMFWPQSTTDYKYYGKMFINNKKTEHTAICATYTVEVLPDGCSNSLITKIHHFTTWDVASTPANCRNVLRLMRTIKTEAGPTTVLSSDGVGRSCAYVLSEVVIALLFKGTPTKLLDVALQLRKQRAWAFKEADILYFTAALIVLDYIRVKLSKHTTAYNDLRNTIANLN